uniref:Putative fimbrial assembly protein PilC n=1 Tax=uncultured Aquificaceae bacterium TaxID=374108 RepID=A0A146JB08_9AQUI|nr:putative fimbrial assembly protein PilC [uncultured Aquificaceae bacterium]
MAINSVSNEYLKESLKDVPDRVGKGESVTKALKDVKILPPLFINLLETGETSGELQSMLNTISQVYDDLTEKIINRWVSLIEPLMMLFIGVIVAVIVVSVIIPITDISAGKIK